MFVTAIYLCKQFKNGGNYVQEKIQKNVLRSCIERTGYKELLKLNGFKVKQLARIHYICIRVFLF